MFRTDQTAERWPLRIGGVCGALVGGLLLARSVVGDQLGWALQYSLLVAVSIVASLWLPILAVNLGTALLWLILSVLPREGKPSVGRRVVKWLNRQIGHIDATATWVAVAVVSTHRVWVQIGGLAAVALLGAPLINELARLDRFGGRAARESHLELLEARRSIIYFATLLGLLVLALRAPDQSMALAPLFAAVLPGLCVRYVRFRLERGGSPRALAASEEALEVTVARLTGWVAPAVILVSFVLSIRVAKEQRERARENASINRAAPLPANTCTPEPGGPVTPTLALFLIADTQIHELAGERFPGQMEIANAFVPVCRRPVELDMLSSAAVVRTASMYRDLQARRAERHLAPALWAHLGDLADLSCVSEMDRMAALLQTFAPAPGLLAGIAPGNHDSAFQGNFSWSPYWDAACDARLGKQEADAAFDALSKKLLVSEAESRRLTGRFPDSLFRSTVAARYTITRLGTIPRQAGAERGVLGIFVDTSDRRASNHGIAGSFGSFSSYQRDHILDDVRRSRASRPAGDPWADPWFVVFTHVPSNELAQASQKELAGLVAALDGPPSSCPESESGCHAPRVIAIVSAHTHIAESFRHCIGKRIVREIVVGSVIDPPEQASLLELGLDASGNGSLRLSTLPTVARPRFTCTADLAISAETCRETMDKLGGYSACHDLVVGRAGNGTNAGTCSALEAPLSVVDELQGLSKYGGPSDPLALRASDSRSAQALLRCLCRPEERDTAPASCQGVLEDPLSADAYSPIVEALARVPSRQAELTCLGWAAAALQAHRATGMTISDAIRCAFEDPTLPAAQVTVASAEAVACP